MRPHLQEYSILNILLHIRRNGSAYFAKSCGYPSYFAVVPWFLEEFIFMWVRRNEEKCLLGVGLDWCGSCDFPEKLDYLIRKKHPHTFQLCTVITFGGFNMPSPGWQLLQVSQSWEHPGMVLVSQGHKIYMLRLDKLPFLSGLNLLHHLELLIYVIMFDIR